MKRYTAWISEYMQDLRFGFKESGMMIKIGVALFGLYLIVTAVLGIYWSFDQETFDVRERAKQEAKRDDADKIVGIPTVASLVGVIDILLHKRGGYLTNDVTLPGLYLDDVPNWEYGVLIQSRDLIKALREAYSRSQSQSTEDEALALAESRYNFGHTSWWIPSTEGEYQEGLVFLRDYLKRLGDEDHSNAQFYARADNLRYWLSTVETRLGSLSQRLSASVGQRRLNIDLAGDSAAQQSTQVDSEIQVKTPWGEIDDVLYEARGSAWALIHFLRAVEVDFADVLEKKNARVSLQQIIRELEGTQQSIHSPMILNGSGFGMLANHSLVMASYISRANAAIIDLRELLSQG